MKYIIISAFFLIAMTVSIMAGDLPPIPKELKGFHYASDKNLTAEENKAIQSVIEVLKKEGKNIDGKDGQGLIYSIKKKDSDYWVMCQSYSINKDGTLSPVVGGYVWIILDKDFKFKEKKQGA